MLDGSRILLTGASAGLAAAMARQLAPRAQALILVARREARLQALKAELLAINPALQVEVRPCDLSSADAVIALGEAALAEGPVDVLINNAGFGAAGFFEEAPLGQLTSMVNVNVLAPTLLSRQVLPAMVARGRGGLLNISSAFSFAWSPAYATYAASKYHLSAFSEALACEVAGAGVQVSHACPGPIDTEFTAVAGTPGDMDPPGWAYMSAPRCARLCLQGFERRQRIIVPGITMKLARFFSFFLPQFLLRLVYGPMCALLRRHLSEQKGAAQRG